jgi:serine/threonine protein kinase
MIYREMEEDEKGLFFNRCEPEGVRRDVEAQLEKLQRRWIERKAERAFRTTSKLRAEGRFVYVKGWDQAPPGGNATATIKKDSKTQVVRHSDHLEKVYGQEKRLKRAWRNIVVLTYMNQHHLVPTTYWVRRPSLMKKGSIAMEDLTGRGLELDRFLDRDYDLLDFSSRRRFASELAHFLASTLNRDIVHRDLKACNLFVRDGMEFVFLDVEDIRFGSPDHAFLKRMLVQLNTTVPVRIRTWDRMRFFSSLARTLKVNRKELLRQVREESLEREIVYEGVAGLRRESWQGPS